MAITRPSTSSISVHRNVVVGRIHRRTNVRYLWWWGRHGRAWWSSQHEDVEERARRMQNIMMQRYSKMLRRKSEWDKTDMPMSWSWRLLERSTVNKMDKKAMSSTEQLRGRLDEHENPKDEPRRPWEEYNHDFEAFKAAVDKAIEKDPYAALFGRRLRPSRWIFRSKDFQRDEPREYPARSVETSTTSKEASIQEDRKSPWVVHSTSSSRTETSLNSTQSTNTDSSKLDNEYIYEPISGRKIRREQPVVEPNASLKENPKPVPTATTSTKDTMSKKGLFETLFSEHGTNIPVKPYKPPKVYGYTGEKAKTAKTDSKNAISELSLENDRKRAFLKLRAATMGNAIDSSNFCTDFEPGATKETTVTLSAIQRKATETVASINTEPEENAPLFSGTTYESKAIATDQVAKTGAGDWLVKEGFSRRPGFTIPSLQSNDIFKSTTKESSARVEPAIDRTSSIRHSIPVKTFSSKLQPSIDRLNTSGESSFQPSTKSQQKVEVLSDKREDIDLLRASDVRAAARTARLTKQEKEVQKNEKRKQLEKDFVTRQADADSLDTSTPLLPSAGITLSGSFSNVWKHIKDYPQGIVAKTMQTIGLPFEPETTATKSASETKPIPSAGQADLKLKHTGSLRTATVKPGVVRNLEIERHVSEFEPKYAALVDMAKTVKRGIHEVSLTVGDITNKRAIAAIAERELSLAKLAPKITQPVLVEAELSKSSHPASLLPHGTAPHVQATTVDFQAPFILLNLNKTTGEVKATSLNSLVGTSAASTDKINPMSILASLNNVTPFVKHFADLDKNGYELSSGGGDVLCFTKHSKNAGAQESVRPRQPEAVSTLASTDALRTTIAAEEVAAQPSLTSSRISSQKPSDDKQAATVLDQLPSQIPIPGPAAPTAPTTSSIRTDRDMNQSMDSQLTSSRPDISSINSERSINRHKPGSKVRRQEQVFSGRRTTPLEASPTSQLSHPRISEDYEHAKEEQSQKQQQPGFFRRMTRFIRRTILTAIAFGGGAYAIGVVAEAINAQAQIEGTGSTGPRKKIVMPVVSSTSSGSASGSGSIESTGTNPLRQRPGIFSTESSR